MKAQKELGLDIPQEAIDAYEKVKSNIRIDKINEREKITRHDVKARIEEFCELAGFEHIHKGMTSRDLTECVERLAEFGEDMRRAAERLDALIDSYPVRGLKGAVGTQLDQLTLFGGDAKKALALDEKVRKHLGIPHCF